jgi:nicotinamidase-related amidase
MPEVEKRSQWTTSRPQRTISGRMDRLHPRTRPAAQRHRRDKANLGVFASTDLENRLKALGVTQVVVTGVATGTGVEATARQAYEQGFNVTLALDAMTDGRPEAHDYSIQHVFPRLGEMGTAQEIVDLLGTRSA